MTTVRPVERQDVQQVINIAFKELPWHRPDTILRRVCSAVDRNDNINMLVDVSNDGVVRGFGCYGRQEFSRNVYGLFMAATNTEFRGQGVGSVLINTRLQTIQEDAQIGDLVMVTTKRPAVFMKIGFSSRPVGEDTFVMERGVFTPDDLGLSKV